MSWHGEVFNNDSKLDIVLVGLSHEHLQLKYSAEADDDFTLDRAVITTRNMDANTAMQNGPMRKAKGRESAIVVPSAPSAVGICLHCEKTGHRLENCFKRKGTMSGKTPPTAPRISSWCSLHNTDRHDNSDCRSQKWDDNKQPVVLVPSNKMASTITTAAITPTPPQLRFQQRKWKRTSR